MICLFIAVLFLAVAVWKHLTLEAIRADVAKVDAKVAALLVKGFQASKDDVRAATSNLKKWV
jgi:hypothetical protein